MAIQDDFNIDVVNRRITFDTAFVDDRPPSIYTVRQLYSYLQDTFDEPGFMQHLVPMTTQTPTQYTLVNGWFIDDESMKALYGGSIQTTTWTKSGSAGITGLRWQNAPADEPLAGDIGVTLTGGTSTATGVLLAVDGTRQIAWVRNTSSAQFQGNEAVTGTGVSFNTETNNGFNSGESIWSNLFSVGSIQTGTEIYVGQEDDYMGGTSFHDATADERLERRIEKLDEWWDSDVDFTASDNLLGGLGHFDILVKTQEAGNAIDSQRLAVFARQFSKVYSHFELTGGVGNFVVPFASGSADLNAQDGPYTVNFDARANADLEVGDILENTTGAGTNSPEFRLRAVVTAVTGGASATGNIEYYLIGDTEDSTNERTLLQLADNDNLKVRGDTTVLDVNGTPTATGPGLADPGAGTVTITFADAQVDVDENGTPEEYGCTIDCANNPLADVYKRIMFLTSRGNQDGTTADVQNTLLPSAHPTKSEAGEFYRSLGDIVFSWDANAGTSITEGQLVDGSLSGATGVVVSATASGATGTAVLTSVKGTFEDNDVVSLITDGTTNTVTIAGTPSSFVDNTAAPFGTFAGGRWFVAQGIVLTNVPTADANNWETIDLTGARRAPPTVRTVTFAGLQANDRAAIFEVDTAGGADVTKNQDTLGADASVAATSLTLSSNVALDVPPTGWIRVADVSSTTGEEYRYAYSSYSGAVVTLDSGAWSTGATTGSESATILTDTGAFTNFGGAGEIRVGMMINNDTLGEWAIVLRKIDANSIETTPLSSGGNWHSAGTADTWTANAVVVALEDGTPGPADTVYFPFIDDTATSGEISKTIKFVANTDCIARARFSDPDIGGQRILPYELRNVTITDANLTVTAIRNDDTIAS